MARQFDVAATKCISARAITIAMLREKWLQSAAALPCYTPDGWWECDVIEITKAGYWVEYEVKTSRADYLADFKKSKTRRGETVTKHGLLESDPTKGPSRFFFVAPMGLIKPEDLPKWAGLIEAYKFSPGGVIMFHYTVKAPRRHEEQHLSFVSSIRRAAYYRHMSDYGVNSGPDVENGACI